MLADLTETQRTAFIWNHYRSYEPNQIAEILGCSPTEIEATLDAINAILYRKTRTLLVNDPQPRRRNGPTRRAVSPSGAPLWRCGRIRRCRG